MSFDDDRPPTRQELREQLAGLVAFLGAELGELAIAIGAHGANGDDSAAYARNMLVRVDRELSQQLRRFKELIVIT
jgi:hypothetical protein